MDSNYVFIIRIGFTLGVTKESNTRTKGRKVEIEKERLQKECGGDDDNNDNDEQVLVDLNCKKLWNHPGGTYHN